MTEARVRPKHETWRDWMPEGVPEPDVLSRDELMEALAERGVNISTHTFDHYRRVGVLPRPVRQHYGGVTQAVYPAWFVPAVLSIRRQLAAGRSLEQIKPTMRAWALKDVRWRDPLEVPIAEARSALAELLRAYGIRDGGVIRLSYTDDSGEVRLQEEWPVIPEMLNLIP